MWSTDQHVLTPNDELEHRRVPEQSHDAKPKEWLFCLLNWCSMLSSSYIVALYKKETVFQAKGLFHHDVVTQRRKWAFSYRHCAVRAKAPPQNCTDSSKKLHLHLGSVAFVDFEKANCNLNHGSYRRHSWRLSRTCSPHAKKEIQTFWTVMISNCWISIFDLCYVNLLIFFTQQVVTVGQKSI